MNMDDEQCDSSSIASDFSIIPECPINGYEADSSQCPIDINVSTSMIKSITDDMNDSTHKMQKSNIINSVTFGTIQRVNNEPTGDLAVIFNAKQDYTLKSSDRIGLYKMGFSSSKDFLNFVWVPVPSSSQLDSLAHVSSSTFVPTTAIFHASNIPEDKSEFYQFCYLTQEGQIAGVSGPFQLEQVERSPLIELENVARNVLVIRVNDLLEEQKKTSLQIKELETQLQEKNKEPTVEGEHFEVVANFDAMSERIEELDLKLLMVNKQLEKAKAKGDELQVQSEKKLHDKESELQELTDIITKLTMDNNEIREKMEVMEEEHMVSDLRLRVVVQDYKESKEQNVNLNQRLEIECKEKEAAQKIAVNLSDNNMKMAKKITALMRIEMKIMETVAYEGFQCVRNDLEETVEEEFSEAPVNTNSEFNVASSVHSTCAREVEESLGNKMDAIMDQLRTIKNENQKSLLNVLKAKAAEVEDVEIASVVVDQDTMAAIPETAEQSLSATISEIAEQNTSISEIVEKNTLTALLENAEQETSTAISGREHEITIEIPEDIEQQENAAAEITFERNNLTEKTKPIVQQPSYFEPLVSYPTLSSLSSFSVPPNVAAMTQTNRHSVSVSATQTERGSCVPKTSSTGTQLPPPLLPETTPAARNAAVLVQFNEGRVPESDDEDFHSTSDAGEVQAQEAVPFIVDSDHLICPMCDLVFLPNSIQLLKEHIDSHLENICPLCSQAFSRNTAHEEFESHVQAHFAGEDVASTRVDSSGPWDSVTAQDTGFHLLEID